MRGLLLAAIAALIVTLGLGCQKNSGSQAYYYQGQPRTNLYPLTSPPPGSVQPVRGYGPTAVSATQDYYGQGSYTGYATGYNTTPASYNPGYYGAGTYNAGYNPGYATTTTTTAGYTGGYGLSQDPFPPGTVGAGAGAMAANPFNPGGGYCRVENVTANMNPNVPIQDPPVVIGNNINLGNTAPAAYTTGYATTGYATTYATQPYAAAAGYSAGAAPQLAATIAAGGPINYNSGPVPYCGPGVACPPDPRVDTSMYGTTSNVPTGSFVQTTLGDSVGTADLVQGGGGYGYTTTASYGSYGVSAPVGTGYASGTDYRGGAYPRAIATIPATYPDRSTTTRNAAQAKKSAPAPVQQTSVNNVDASEFRLVPALDVPPGIHPNDAGPSQWFEIIRPGNGPMRIGRVSATCVCVGVRVPKRFIAAGERALIEARIVAKPPVNNLTYGIYVNVVEPQKTVLDADVTITL